MRSGAWIVAGALACPRLAEACAVCFSATDDSRAAYVFTTVLLSILPLLVLGGFFLWARRRSRALARELQPGAPAAPRVSPRETPEPIAPPRG